MARYFQICPTCGEDAFEYTEKPYKEMLMSLNYIKHEDTPKVGDTITCQKCKAKLTNNSFVPSLLRTQK